MEDDSVILLTIKLGKEEVEKNTLAAGAAIARLKKELRDLQKEYDKQIITAEEFAKSELAITTQLEKANAQYKEGKKVLAEYAKSEKEAQDIISSLSAKMKDQANVSAALQKRVSALAAEFAKEAADIDHLGSSIDGIDDKISKLTAEINGLTKAQRDNPAIGGVMIKQLSSLERTADKSQKTIERSKKGLADFVKDIDILGFNIGSTVESFKSGAQGVGMFTKSIFTGRGALIALGAVPIIAVLSGLYIILTKSQKGMDFLERATSGVTAVFSALSNKVIAIGEAFVGAFDNPKKALVDLGNFVETNLINRFKAFGVILDAIRSGDLTKITDGFIQLGTGIEGAATGLKKVYKQGSAVAFLNQQIREDEIKLNTERAKSEKILEAQKQIAEDTTKSFQTRKKAEQSAIAESLKIQQKEEAVQRKRIQLANQEAKAGTGSAEQRRKIAEEEAKLDEIAKNRIGERTELQNQLNSINAEEAAKSLENRKKAAKEEADEAEVALIVAKRKGEDTIAVEQEVYERTLKYIEAKRLAELVGIKKNSSERKLINAKADTEALEAAREFATKTADIIYQAKQREIDTNLAFTQRGSKEELEERVKAINADRVKQLAAAKVRITDTKALEDEEARIIAVAGRAIGDARQAFAEADINQLAAAQDRRLQTEYDLGAQTIEAERDLAGKRIDLEEDTQKKLLSVQLEYGQLTIDQHRNLVNAVESAAILKRKELAKQRIEDARAVAQQVSDVELSIAKEGSKKQLEEQKKQLKLKHAADLAAAKENKELIDAADKDFKDKSAKAQAKYNTTVYDSIIDSATRLNSTLSTLVDAQTARQLRALDDQQTAVLSSSALSADQRAKIEEKFQKKRDELEKKAAEKRRKIASLENLIATAQGITASFKLLPPFNYTNAALVAAAGLAQQVVIDNQKFAVGGVYRSDGKGAYIQGPGTGTSDSINARISNGESILTAKATQMFYPQLSAMNVAGGGKPFTGFKYAAPAMDLSNATPRFSYGGTMASVDTNAIANAIIEGMQRADIRVAVDEITKKQAKYAKSQASGDI